MKFEVRHDCHILKNQIWLRVTVSRILFNSIKKFVRKSPTRMPFGLVTHSSPSESKGCVTHHESVPRISYLSNWSIQLVILFHRGCASFGQHQQSRSNTESSRFTDFPSNLRNLIGREYEMNTLSLFGKSGPATGRDSGWRPKEARPLRTRMFSLCIGVVIRWIINNYSQRLRWIVVDIFQAAKWRGKYSPDSPTLRWIIVLVYTTQAE